MDILNRPPKSRSQKTAGPKGPDCLKCRHFFITWDNNNPRGCRFFGFKSQYYPSMLVRSSSGSPCQSFEKMCVFCQKRKKWICFFSDQASVKTQQECAVEK